jgi:hypothetical protein
MGAVEATGSRHGHDGDEGAADRLKVRLECRHCKRPLLIRAGKFDAVLDQVADTGRDSATLSELREILRISGRS